MSLLGIADREYEMLGLNADALLATARRHEKTLHQINVAPLSSIRGLTEEYLHWFDHLFLLTFFYDYCLDRSEEEQYPEAFFISANMYHEYRAYVMRSFGGRGLAVLDRYNAEQVYYQTIERQWENPEEYSRVHPNYSEYYKKQILCLAHVELLSLDSSSRELSKKLVDLYRNYWSLILLIDDIVDVDLDVASKTLTPMITSFYATHGSMPEITDVESIRKEWMPEIERLLPDFIRAANRLGNNGFIDVINGLRNRLEDYDRVG